MRRKSRLVNRIVTTKDITGRLDLCHHESRTQYIITRIHFLFGFVDILGLAQFADFKLV